MVVSLTRIYYSVVIAVATSCWLLKTGGDVGSGFSFRTDNRSSMIIAIFSVAVIVGSAHMEGKMSTVLNVLIIS